LQLAFGSHRTRRNIQLIRMSIKYMVN
jgi:hypothetical protein